MQRSGRALLRRRALEEAIGGKHHLYSISLSLVLILWGLVFLVSLWTSCGKGRKGVDFDSGRMCEVNNTRLNETIYLLGKDSCPNTGSEVGDLYSPVKDTHIKTSSEVLSRSSNNSAAFHDGEASTVEWNKIQGVKIDGPSNAKELNRVVPLSLDEFRSKVFSTKNKPLSDHIGGVEHRLEPGGAEYNYASASKGAKVLAFNKEAKGAFNILGKDKDKYLRNPCSAEDKFVVIEVSEETLVDTIVTGNFEHHSSNLKEFELLGSLVYPTDQWFELGNFTAANVKQSQRFSLPKPKWVRYLKMNLLTHYGTEFYCTLSIVEVYGVDAVERMLEDLISAQDDIFSNSEIDKEPRSVEVREGNDACHLCEDINLVCADVPDTVKEIRSQQTSRMPGDTVLKVVMQKVHSLDFDLSVLARYLEHLSSKQQAMFDASNKNMHDKDMILEKVRYGVESLLENWDVVAKEINDLILWKASLSEKLEILSGDNKLLRSEMAKVKENQVYMDNKGILVFLLCAVFGFLALIRVFIWFYFVEGKPEKFCRMPWIFLLTSCTLIMLIISL